MKITQQELDLLPSDIIGTQILNYKTNLIETKLGPVCANFVLLDELNLNMCDELKNVVEELNGERFGSDYVHMTNQSEIGSIIEALQENVNNLEITEDMESKEGYTDIYYLFVIPLLLLIVDFIYYKRKI